MLELKRRVAEGSPAAASEPSRQLVLPFDTRQKSRFRAELDDGSECWVEIERGTMLRDGDRLCATTGEVVLVRAAPERVSVGRASDPLLHARACYHLGNRHVPLQIETTLVSYQHDHVLDDMLRSLGLEVSVEERPFEPEAGAYGSGHAHHGHGHHH